MKCKKCKKEFEINEDKIRVIIEQTRDNKKSTESGFWIRRTLFLYHIKCFSSLVK